jgi:hypothetical protein
MTIRVEKDVDVGRRFFTFSGAKKVEKDEYKVE